VFGEIHICQFPFTSGTISKTRPALVPFDCGRDVIICRVTSASAAGPMDVPIQDWQASGLLNPSVARLDRIVTAEKSVLMRRLGHLSAHDLAAVRAAWNRQMRL
jgi:mRNA-degrading endonuclease toxin of MazEF toxin-antitoxin module